MRIIFIILIVIAALAETCCAQSAEPTVIKKRSPWRKPDHQFGYNFSYSYQTQTVLELGGAYYHKITTGRTHEDFKSRTFVDSYHSTGGSLNFVIADRFIFAPKIFTNICYKTLFAQVNLSAYTDLKKIEPILTPEIGIGKYVGIRYGYNFKLMNKSFPEMGNHRLVVFINVYFAHLSQLR